MEAEPQEGELGVLVSSPEFARMVDRFQASTGLKLQVFDLDAHPLTPVEDYPRYCRLLQERKVCPLYNDPEFLKRNEETIAVCKSGVGHFIAPVRDEKEVPIGAVLSPAVKFGPNSVEEFAELAFELKIFPDDLIQAADAVQAHDPERLLGAGELVSVGLNLLAEMQAKERVGNTLRRLQAQIAESNSQMLSQHVVDAILYLTRADYALVLMLDDNGADLASGYDQPAPDQFVEAKRRLLEGIAEWVRHADRSVTVPDISKSAWSRYLTEDVVKEGSIVGVPITEQKGKGTFGAIVVGFDRPRHDLDLAVVLFESEAFEVLRGKYGESGLSRILREFVAVVRAKTRRVNTLARVRDGQFCLVIPEADRGIAVRQADRLRVILEEHPYAASPNGDIVRLAVDTGVADSERGGLDRVSLLSLAEESLQQARSERRTRSFNP